MYVATGVSSLHFDAANCQTGHHDLKMDGEGSRRRFYQHVSGEEEVCATGADRMTHSEQERVRRVLLKKEQDKLAGIDLWGVFWIMAMIFVVHYFDVKDALVYDRRLNRTLFMVGLGLLGLSMAVGTYCIYYLGVVRKIENYDVHSPWAVPTAAFSGFVGWVIITISVWSIWSWMTLLIVPSCFMGILVFFITISPMIS
eukprot:m.56069 g.56069  ORF g.56069 m.56069 type:complete len:199 (+) comp12577_c0_seq1:526-1122(+)